MFSTDLIRRLTANDFESVDPRSFIWFVLVASSLIFWLLHGNRWIAGLIYSGVILRRGRIGDAIVAPAATNTLIACSVLTWRKWNPW